MIAEPTDIRRLFGIVDSEKTDGDCAAAIAYASKKIESETGRKWTGHATREFLGESDGSKVVYHTGLRPIMDGAFNTGSSITTTAADVTVETRDRVPGAFTLIGASGYTVDGTLGEVVFDVPLSKGTKVYATYYYDTFAIREAEAALAAYFLVGALPDGQERAAEIWTKYREAMLKLPLYGQAAIV